MKNRFEKIKKMLLVIILPALLPLVMTGAVKESNFELILNNISSKNESEISITGLNTKVASHLNLLDSESGVFSDIDYDDKSATDWQPVTHLDRLKDFVFAYTMTGSDYYESDAVYNNILKTLEHWYQKHPTSNNWWNVQIAIPRSLGVSLIQMRKGKQKIPANIEQKHIERLADDAGDPEQEEGANLTDIAMDYFYRACLNENTAELEKAIGYAFSPLMLSSTQDSETGIRYDYSFHQHGHQLHLGGYGEELIKGVVEFALNVKDSDYALKGEQLDVFSNFVRNGYLPAIRGQYIQYNAMGRGVSRKDATLKSGFSKFINSIKTLDPAFAADYDNAVKRMQGSENAAFQVEDKNKLFPVSDYSLHNRSTFTFGVRAVSERTTHVEKGNNENLKGYFLSHGSTSFTNFGNEYRDVFPVWNWARVPGVTSPQVTTIPQRKDWGVPGTGTFTGGVSDSLYGAFVFVLDDKIDGRTTKAKKSWFMFDDEVVALGAGITSDSEFSINTTVEQSLLKDAVTVSDGGTETVVGIGEHSYPGGIDWVLHNRVGYFFPNKGNIRLINKEQSGSWKSINGTLSDEAINKDVFTLLFDHGNNPANSTYEYIILPNKLTAQSMKNHKIDNIEVLANSDEMQVVEHRGLGMWMLVFYEAGKFTHNRLEIEVDKPAVVMLKDATTPKVTMHVADPAQTQSDITVKMMIPSVSDKSITTECDLSSLDADYAGFSKAYTIEKPEDDGDQEIEIIYTIDVPVLGDTYVNGGSLENTNYGKADNMLIKMNPVNYNREGFIKLSLEALGNLNDPDTEDVGKVELALTTIYTNASTDQIYWTLNPVPDTSWDENTMTYLTKPDFEDVVIAQHQGHVRGQGVKDQVFFDITDYARTEYAKGKTEIALRIYNNREASDGLHDTKFASKEHPDANRHPKMVIGVIKKAAAQTHTITLPELTGASFDLDAGEHEVETGENFSFSLILDTNYSNSKPVVKVNDEVVEPAEVDLNSGIYHYELLLIEDDIVVEVEDIVENDFKLKSIRINGEVLSDIENAYYLVDCDNELTSLDVQLEVPTGVYMNVDEEFEVNITKPVRRVINIEIGRSEDKIENSYTLIIEKRFDFYDIVIPKFNRRLVVNNNPATNNGYSFEDYTWYKNGTQVGKGQIYAEPNNELLDPTADYQLVVKTTGEESMELRTCPAVINLTPEARVYPVPAQIGETVTIELDDTNPEGLIKIYNLSGVKVIEKVITGKQMTVQFKDAGIYIIQADVNNNITSHKVIVK